jgi:hypothetical protein
MRRRLGRGLVAYGVIGLVALVVVGIGLGIAVVRARDVLDRIEQQRVAVVRLLDATSLLLGTTASSVDRLGTTLSSTEEAVRRGAELTRTLSTAGTTMADLAAVDILGLQPFAGAAVPFGTLSEQATSLAVSLDSTAVALDTNRVDLATLVEDLRGISADLEDIEASIVDVRLVGDVALSLGLVVVIVLLAWLSVPAFAAIVLGRRLMRDGGRYPPDREGSATL